MLYRGDSSGIIEKLCKYNKLCEIFLDFNKIHINYKSASLKIFFRTLLN